MSSIIKKSSTIGYAILLPSCCKLTCMRFSSRKISPAKHSRALLASSKRKEISEEEVSYSKQNTSISLKVIGSGAGGFPRSLGVYLGTSSVLFNCGEGTCRVSAELNGLKRFNHIFITHNKWENVSGIPGLRQTFITETGLAKGAKLSTYGPSAFSTLWNSISSMDNLWVPLEHRHSDDNTFHIDSILKVQQIPIHRKIPAEKNSSEWISQDLAYAYLCHIPKTPTKLDISLMVEAGVSPGAMVNRLKDGYSVTLDDGRIVHPSDVQNIYHGGNFLVVEVPDFEYLDSFLSSNAFDKFKMSEKDIGCATSVTENLPHAEQNSISSVKRDPFPINLRSKVGMCSSKCRCAEDLGLVIHFTPPHIMQDERYINWANSFSADIKHIVINNKSCGMHIERAIEQQIIMNYLLPNCFPLFKSENLKHLLPSHRNKMKKMEKKVESGSKSLEDYFELMGNGNTADITNLSDNDHDGNYGLKDNKLNVNSNLEGSKDSHNSFKGKTYQADSQICFSIRPSYGEISTEKSPVGVDNCFVRNLYVNELFIEELEIMKKQFKNLEMSLDKKFPKIYPSVTFLGTGSASSNSKRNVAGILIQMTENSNIIMDCGDSTYSQLVALEGIEKTRDILLDTKAIYVSHHHCDHHMGLLTLILEKIKAHKEKNVKLTKLYILGPPLVLQYLKSFHSKVQPILQDLICINNMSLIRNSNAENHIQYKDLCKTLNLVDFGVTFVRHCKDSFGVAITHADGWKICYSGDCMPCGKLISVGRDCDLLIHEATFADHLERDAAIKQHSTVSQAIDISKRMNAKNVILTHFSQRYANLPFIEGDIPPNVGVASDFMKVTLDDLPFLSHLYPVLRAIYENDMDRHRSKDYRKTKIHPQLRWSRAVQELQIE